MDFQAILTTLGSWCTNTGIKIIVSVILLIVAFKLINLLAKKIRKKQDAKPGKLDATVFNALLKAAMVLLKVLAVICIINYLGIDTSGITALIASLGVCFGLAVDGALGNIAGGVLLLITRPFKIGDYVDIAGQEGTVEAINLVSTKLITVDNKVIYVPNGTASGACVKNFSEKENRRVDHSFTIPYGEDFTKAISLIEDVLKREPLVLQDPAIQVRIVGDNKNGNEITCRAWVKSGDYWTAYFNILEAVKKELAAQGIEVPGEQLEVKLSK